MINWNRLVILFEIDYWLKNDYKEMKAHVEEKPKKTG